MKLAQAAEILGLTGKADLEAVKLAYRRACMKYHPDRGGSNEMMQAVNAAYAMLQSYIGDLPTEGRQEGYGDSLNEAINAIVRCEGLVIEVCGLWVWVSGQTREYKEVLKAAGYRWASKKHQWYFRPDEVAGGKHTAWDMSKIRQAYGSSRVMPEREERLAA